MQSDINNIEHKNRKLWISIILIIILILVCLYFASFGKITYSTLIPTGNVDIFDITAGSACEVCETCEVCDESEPTFKETDENLDVIVYDDIDLINNQVNLRIFDNAAFEYIDRIAPGVYNSYHFIVRNNNSYNIIYNLKMLETNKYGINMKYRLKVDGKYVYGSDYKWVTANELIRKNIPLSAKDYHTYNLDWKWFDSDNDTYIGENAEEDYVLDINITAKKG